MRVIPARQCRDWSELPEGTAIRLSSWTEAEPVALPSILEEMNESVVRQRDSGGYSVQIEIGGVARAAVQDAERLLAAIAGQDIVAVVDYVGGSSAVMGSKGYPLRLSLESATEGRVRTCRWTIQGRSRRGPLPVKG